MHAATGILFNHESPRRGETFVTRKITRALARIVAGTQDKLYLGNLEARRDWGHAADYVRAMWLMLQADTPADYVIGTGESYSIRDFLDRSFGVVGLDWEPFVEIDPAYFRPTEVEFLQADPSLAVAELGWTPEVSFDALVAEMVAADLAEMGLTIESARELAGGRSIR